MTPTTTAIAQRQRLSQGLLLWPSPVVPAATLHPPWAFLSTVAIVTLWKLSQILVLFCSKLRRGPNLSLSGSQVLRMTARSLYSCLPTLLIPKLSAPPFLLKADHSFNKPHLAPNQHQEESGAQGPLSAGGIPVHGARKSPCWSLSGFRQATIYPPASWGLHPQSQPLV